jgi:hypothetical protein
MVADEDDSGMGDDVTVRDAVCVEFREDDGDDGDEPEGDGEDIVASV